MPSVHEKGETLYTIPDLPPDLTTVFKGCPFAPRCDDAEGPCDTTPTALQVVETAHESACRRVQEGEL